MHKNSEGEKIQQLVLETKSGKLENQGASKDLLKNVSMQLFNLMSEVTKSEVSPATVNAACNCASEIHKILKLNLEVQRQK